MRLVFLFNSDGPSPEGSNFPWDPHAPSHNFFATGENGLPSEGYLYMLHEMLNQGIIDDLIVFIESNRSPGFTTYYQHVKCYVVPEIGYVRQFLRNDDVIFARGGFRSWFNFLNRMKEEQRWLLLYAANTGRARWKFWDIVFDDLEGRHRYDSRGRFFYYFKKPINPDYFRPLYHVPKRYDICVGASHVHDRKAQWKTIEVIAEYKRLFGGDPKCVMPGRVTHGVKTNDIGVTISNARLSVHCPGMVPRKDVCRIFNESHVAVFMGQGGQNDRGPLEALQCGTPVLLASTARHCPSIWDRNEFCKVVEDPNDITNIAYELRELFKSNKRCRKLKHRCHGKFDQRNGLYTVVLPEMERLFNVIRKNPKPNVDCLIGEYI